MPRRTINFGRYPNDRAGTGVRRVNQDINSNFEELYDGVSSLVTATGTDTYAIDYDSNYTEYTAGDKFFVKFTDANTGAATLDINGVGAVAIKKNVDEALTADDIKAGQICLVTYDGTYFQIISGDSGSVSHTSDIIETV